MKTYTAYFYTDAGYASTEIEAPDPHQALEKAKARYQLKEGDGLIFDHYDQGQPVNHVEILDADGNDVAHWRDAELLLRMAAHDMLSLLKRINDAFYVKGTRTALLDVMKETKPLIARAEGR